MPSTQQNYDFVIVGAGIVGLAISREILARNPEAKLLLLEKEAKLAAHASGRNSGVLHAGLYYSPDSLKAKLCVVGAKKLRTYCQDKGITLNTNGKVIVPTSEESLAASQRLYENGQANGVVLEMIDGKTLREIEPEANSEFDSAIYSPTTAVFDPVIIMKSLRQDIAKKGATIKLAHPAILARPSESSIKLSDGSDIGYGVLVNAAGAYADKIAHWYSVGREFRILPFKGIYYQMRQGAKTQIRGNIYPVPDPKMPFLGIHFTCSPDNKTIVGPCALPALGRENYHGMQGVKVGDFYHISTALARQYVKDTNGFRQHVHRELPHLWARSFYRDAKKLVPNLLPAELVKSEKVGIRAQLYNSQTKELEHDFVVKTGKNSVHVLNAISPAFTCSLEFASYVYQEYIAKITNQEIEGTK